MHWTEDRKLTFLTFFCHSSLVNGKKVKKQPFTRPISRIANILINHCAQQCPNLRCSGQVYIIYRQWPLRHAFFCTLSKKLSHEKNSKNVVQEKNSAKFCPKTQPYAGFSLLKTYKKLPLWKKLIFLLSKLNFYPWKLNAPQAAGLKLPAKKCTKKCLP